jgi:hypothetical protein
MALATEAIPTIGAAYRLGRRMAMDIDRQPLLMLLERRAAMARARFIFNASRIPPAINPSLWRSASALPARRS